MAQQDLETIYGRHYRMVYWTAYGLLQSHSDAGDISQTVFLKAIKHMGSVSQMEDCRLRSWLYRVTVNACLDLKRREKHEIPLEELPDVPAEGFDLPEERAVTMEQRRLVRSSIEKLPDIYREAVLLHYFSGLNYREIGKLTGVPEGTVKARIFRAKQRLCRLLKEGEKID